MEFTLYVFLNSTIKKKTFKLEHGIRIWVSDFTYNYKCEKYIFVFFIWQAEKVGDVDV